MELVRHRRVSWWGINWRLLPGATEAPALLVDLQANIEDCKVTH